MWKKILVGLIVGFISGMFASGGGLLLIPAYIHFFDSSEKEARATAVFCILPMVLVTAIFYGTGNYINWKTGILCCIGGIIGRKIFKINFYFISNLFWYKDSVFLKDYRKVEGMKC